MNLKRLIRNKQIKDDWSVTPSSFLIKRLVSSLESSYDIIEKYFPHDATENEYLSDLEDMMVYFNEYK